MGKDGADGLDNVLLKPIVCLGTTSSASSILLVLYLPFFPFPFLPSLVTKVVTQRDPP